jgi:prepilin-type N-terminal cleavage/methylation domain-containing protein
VIRARRASDAPAHSRTRRGFTLVESLIAIVILAGVVLAMTMGTSVVSRSVVSSSGRTRAQSIADLQISRARAWPTYATLPQLATAKYNGTVEGFTVATTVSVDSLSGRNITRIAVTVSSASPAVLAAPVSRTISIAAP